MAVITAAVGAVVTGVGFLNSLVGEGWTRYFLLLAGLVGSNVIGGFTGIYPLESVIGFVVANVFQIQGFVLPVYAGLSSLLMIAIIMPFVILLFKHGLGST